ncbi:MAG TPA: hypothetical protein PLR71_14720, partial [Deltaproteobacteria bacterium]|nr:hypothetical protein [Deltaproteobacteria bacterium]
MPENVSLLGISTPGGQGMHDTIEGTAVSWLARTIGHCNPLIAHPSERMFLHKALLEMALLVAYRVRFDPSPLDESYQLILEHVDSIARLPPYYERVARDHNSLLLYGLTYAALRLCGRDHRVFRHAIQKSLFTRHCLVAERIPYRLLDLLHFLSLGGFDHDGPSPEDVFRFTILSGDPNIVEMGDSDVYAVTHTVFYLTDFGFRSSTWSGSFDMDRAVSLVGALLRHYTHLRNADLSAELIATSICLGASHSEDVRHAWRFLHEIQEPDGRVPGPPGVIDETMTAADFGADYCSWKTSYHTTLVCALAGLMTRRGETVPGYPALQKHTTPVQERSDAILLQSCGEAISHASVFLERCLGCSETAIRLRALAGLAMCIRLPGQCLPPIETVKTAVME